MLTQLRCFLGMHNYDTTRIYHYGLQRTITVLECRHCHVRKGIIS